MNIYQYHTGHQVNGHESHSSNQLLKLGISLGFDKKYFGIIQGFQR